MMYYFQPEIIQVVYGQVSVWYGHDVSVWYDISMVWYGMLVWYGIV